jgi:glycosyltransferase involved in cell wall biosynthesis
LGKKRHLGQGKYMKVGVISDSPAITTGYGIVTNQCCRALLEAGHYVTCFGFKDTWSNDERQQYPCPIRPIDPFEQWHPKLRDFVASEAPDVLWIYMDMYNLEEVMTALGDTQVPPLSLYAIFDGLPVYRRLIDLLDRFCTIVVTTDVAAAYLKVQGYPVYAVAPPGIDSAMFQPLDRKALRLESGIQDAFVVGAFGRNTERKQQPRLLQALQSLAKTSNGNQLLLYFHCAQRGYWDLADLAVRWGVRNHAIFADDLIDETRGVPIRRHQPGLPSQKPRIPASFGYVERLNLCDMVINIPHSGDFEQVLVEAPACAVPVAGTDDGGIMREALGPGWPLTANERSVGNAGQMLHFVAISAIEEAIRFVKCDPEGRQAMAERGRAHALAHEWGPVRRAIVSAVEVATKH